MRMRVLVNAETTVLGWRTKGSFTLDAVLLMAVSKRSARSLHNISCAAMFSVVYRLPFDFNNKKNAAPTRSSPKYGVDVAAAEGGAGAAAGARGGNAAIGGAGPVASTAYVSV